jgi:hypothetical protein
MELEWHGFQASISGGLQNLTHSLPQAEAEIPPCARERLRNWTVEKREGNASARVQGSNPRLAPYWPHSLRQWNYLCAFTSPSAKCGHNKVILNSYT